MIIDNKPAIPVINTNIESNNFSFFVVLLKKNIHRANNKLRINPLYDNSVNLGYI